MPHFGLFDERFKVAYGDNTCFVEYHMTFCPALPSWFCKLSNETLVRLTVILDCDCAFIRC